MSEENDLSQWQEIPSQDITLDQMDALVQSLRAKREEHKVAKEAAAAVYAQVEEAEKAVIGALKASGKTKYEAEGVGLVYISHKTTYATPKSNEDKTSLFNYIKEKFGPDALMSMVGINHQTLNSWANKELEENPTAKIPGLADPTAEEILNFRSR